LARCVLRTTGARRSAAAAATDWPSLTAVAHCWPVGVRGATTVSSVVVSIGSWSGYHSTVVRWASRTCPEVAVTAIPRGPHSLYSENGESLAGISKLNLADWPGARSLPR